MKDKQKQLFETVRRMIKEEVTKLITSLTDITGKDNIKSYADKVIPMLRISYKTDSMPGVNSLRQFGNNVDMLTICGNEDAILAAALYRTDLGGYKMTHICGVQDAVGKEAMQSIIRRDIHDWDCWYWAEVSGAIEHWFKKYNGYPIPNPYAKFLLNRDVSLCDDGFHYSRPIGEDGEVFKKMIFGFKDKAFFDRVIKDFDDYEEIRDKQNLQEAIDGFSELVIPDLRYVTYFVATTFDRYVERNLCEMTPGFRRRLIDAKKCLLQWNKVKPMPMIDACLSRVDALLEEMPMIEIHKI